MIFDLVSQRFSRCTFNLARMANVAESFAKLLNDMANLNTGIWTVYLVARYLCDPSFSPLLFLCTAFDPSDPHTVKKLIAAQLLQVIQQTLSTTDKIRIQIVKRSKLFTICVPNSGTITYMDVVVRAMSLYFGNITMNHVMPIADIDQLVGIMIRGLDFKCRSQRHWSSLTHCKRSRFSFGGASVSAPARPGDDAG